METYSLLREFADSWWLAVMMAFFVGVSLYALRPGSARVHKSISEIPLRDDAPISERGDLTATADGSSPMKEARDGRG